MKPDRVREGLRDRLTPWRRPPVPGALPHAQRSIDAAIAKGILATVLLGFFTVGLVGLLYSSDSEPVRIALCAAGMAIMFAMQMLYFTRPQEEIRSWPGTLMLILQGVISTGPLLFLGTAWIGVPGFFSGSLLLVLPIRFGIPAFLAVCAFTGVAELMLDGTATDVAFTTVSTVITGLVVYGLTRLAATVRELAEARAEIIRLAIAEERFRFASDLHDVLGYSLSAITLKTELANRLATRRSRGAAADEQLLTEIDEILSLSRSALTNVRTVASGYRSMSVRDELTSVRSVLESAGIAVSADIQVEVVPPRIDTVLALVLREAATNVLRHSRADRCDVRLVRQDHRIVMEISNDGVGTPGRSPRSSGLRSLEQRLVGIEGSLRWSTRDDRFHLVAAAPVTAAVTPDVSPA